MFKAITFTDVHLADKNPISRKDNYCESIFNKLEQVSEMCEYLEADVAICAGDLFHVKAPGKNSHLLVSELIQSFKKFPCPVYTIIGNHDISQDNLRNLPKQPINTLLKAGACHELRDVSFCEGKIRIFGIDYLDSPEYSDFSRNKDNEAIQICVAHVNASSKFDDLFGERVYTYQELEKTSPNIFVFGHYHPDQGIEIRKNKHFINVGALSRGSLSKDDISRIPNVGYIEIDNSFNITTKKISLNVLSSSEIFDLEKKGKEEQEQKEMQKFIEELKDKVNVNKVDNIADKIKSLQFGEEIVNKALYYYEKVL